MLQLVEPTQAALEAATSYALLVSAAAPEGLAGAVRATVCAMRQARGFQGGGEELGADLQARRAARPAPLLWGCRRPSDAWVLRTSKQVLP